MSKDNNYKAINIRVKADHNDKQHQTKMIGLFKHNAYKKGMTQAEFFALCINQLYKDGFLDPEMHIHEAPEKQEQNQILLDDLFSDNG